jgi:hypothetical protein
MNLYRLMRIERPPDENLLKILERLAEKGYLQNNQQLKHVLYNLSHISPFLELICSMENLEKLDLDYKLTLEDLARVFQSCSKLIELRIATFGCKTHKMAEHLKNQLKPGFQRLRRLELVCFIDNGSWPMFKEMLT